MKMLTKKTFCTWKCRYFEITAIGFFVFFIFFLSKQGKKDQNAVNCSYKKKRRKEWKVIDIISTYVWKENCSWRNKERCFYKQAPPPCFWGSGWILGPTSKIKRSSSISGPETEWYSTTGKPFLPQRGDSAYTVRVHAVVYTLCLEEQHVLAEAITTPETVLPNSMDDTDNI